MNRDRFAIALAAGLGLFVTAVQVNARTLSVRVDRWLEFRSIAGEVRYTQAGRSQPAQPGVRLGRVGDAVHTGRQSSARLAVDTEVGFVMVSENTDLRISRLQASPSGGRMTELTIERGQARLQVRPFTNPDSEFEIRTPAGVSGVRGTEFGVAVQPDGRTGVATLEGSIEASAQGESVTVPAGFQTLIVQGEPPTPPVPLTDDPGLDVTVLRSIRVDGAAGVQLAGRIDPVNLLMIEGMIQPTDRTGAFDVQLPVGDRIRATVVTPLGTEQLYELVVP